MLELIELFAPFMLFISFFVTVVFNLWLVSIKANWIAILIANILLILIMDFLGLADYNFLNKVLEWIFDLISNIFTLLWNNTIGRLVDLIASIFGLSPDSGGTPKFPMPNPILPPHLSISKIF